MFSKTIIACLIIPYLLGAQSPRLSSSEFKWAIFHPVAALKVKKITKKCNAIFFAGNIKQELDSFSSGGLLDAYRHTFYMAAYAQKIRIKKIRKLGQAHEKANYRQFQKMQNEEGEIPDSLSSVMDLRNNELGFALGCNNRSLALPALKAKVIEEIKAGKAIVFKRNTAGNYVTCDDKPLKRVSTKSWYVPKCLVPSNHKSSS